MAAPLTYAEVSAAMGALLMLFVGLSLRELITLMRQILTRQRECLTLYADRERNDKAHKEFYDGMEDLNVRVTLLEKEHKPRCDGED